ncbi:uncharacterized protein PV09_07753 [Verruconis gallopava]|uniref:Mitochondrial pyruvate carrier n=1 Tax=Verruconis gallopava TaxID=253628 RepID=A0A0D2A1Y6_9PEZI|nr:uncharacterized protein PV09_07753 [Verruconis gallopava]KIW00773.1 hypothetical protein PV09_07753 [Verruconis gallopava]
MSQRAGLRLLQASKQAGVRSSFRQAFFRRNASTAAEASPASTEGQSAFQKLWNSPVGPKTVHFWAPIMKWGIVLAGAADMARPAEKLSLTQNFALMCTGAIWTRWCLIIKPKNVFLATVNAFLFCVGATQVTRIALYRRSEKGKNAVEEAKEAVQEKVETLKQ